MRNLLTFLLVVILAGSFWYVRTAIYAPSHNPVYPIQIQYGDTIILKGIDSSYRSQVFPWHHIPEDLRDRLDRSHVLTVLEGALDPWGLMNQGPKHGGFGPVFGVLLLPAAAVSLLWAAWRREWGVVVLVGCLVVSFALMPPHGHTWSRFILPVTLVGFVGFAYILRRLT